MSGRTALILSVVLSVVVSPFFGVNNSAAQSVSLRSAGLGHDACWPQAPTPALERTSIPALRFARAETHQCRAPGDDDSPRAQALRYVQFDTPNDIPDERTATQLDWSLSADVKPPSTGDEFLI